MELQDEVLRGMQAADHAQLRANDAGRSEVVILQTHANKLMKVVRNNMFATSHVPDFLVSLSLNLSHSICLNLTARITENGFGSLKYPNIDRLQPDASAATQTPFWCKEMLMHHAGTVPRY